MLIMDSHLMEAAGWRLSLTSRRGREPGLFLGRRRRWRFVSLDLCIGRSDIVFSDKYIIVI